MIKIENMSKKYGLFPAVLDVSFEILKGEVVGFLGPNGAGKTTTMRVITGYTPPSSGTVTIGGYDVLTHSLEVRRYIGYLPETVPLYLDMTVTDYLIYMGKIRGMNKAWIAERLPLVIDLVQLGDYRDTLIGRLSKGYRQRTGIAQAVLHEPDVLILDEPTIGIDPIQVVETRSLIKNLGDEHTLLLSSHILPEVSMICQRVLVIHDGRIIADDKPSLLSEKLQPTERIELGVKGAKAADVIAELRSLTSVVDVRTDPRADVRERAQEQKRLALLIESRPDSATAERIADLVIDKGWKLTNLNPVNMTLEEIFLQLTTEDTAEAAL